VKVHAVLRTGSSSPKKQQLAGRTAGYAIRCFGSRRSRK
jgi:hypothetical protein